MGRAGPLCETLAGRNCMPCSQANTEYAAAATLLVWCSDSFFGLFHPRPKSLWGSVVSVVSSQVGTEKNPLKVLFPRAIAGSLDAGPLPGHEVTETPR